jgi:homoserine dehydrogenase
VSSNLDVVVLKFGSSVLRNVASLPVAVTEVYRHYREGDRVIAVVSAFEGVTDRLLESASIGGDAPDAATMAVLLSTGEIQSAAQLTLALHRAGLPARFVDPRDIELTAVDDRGNAELVRVHVDKLYAGLNEAPVLVVPGFFAQSAQGGLALLGRGGSDLTALYLAAELRARCTVLKDVDGLYESDPAQPNSHPRRFALASYATAEACGGALVQGKAVRLAHERAIAFDLARIGGSVHTRIGEGPTIVGHTRPSRRIRVALLGLGTVGGGVLQYLAQFPERFEVVAALVRTPAKHIARGVPRELLVDAPDKVWTRDPELVVEALPGIEPARTCLEAELTAGLRVVTANKALLAAHWDRLAPHLRGPRRQLRYAAAVGGAAPMLERIERLSLRGPVTRLRGIVNGTCNFVLDARAQGSSFEAAVRLAQQRGFTEADATADLGGLDAARKMEILGRVAFGGVPTCAERLGLTEESSRLSADQGPLCMRLVAEAERTEAGFRYSIAPRALPLTDFLSQSWGKSIPRSARAPGSASQFRRGGLSLPHADPRRRAICLDPSKPSP